MTRRSRVQRTDPFGSERSCSVFFLNHNKQIRKISQHKRTGQVVEIFSLRVVFARARFKRISFWSLTAGNLLFFCSHFYFVIRKPAHSNESEKSNSEYVFKHFRKNTFGKCIRITIKNLFKLFNTHYIADFFFFYSEFRNTRAICTVRFVWTTRFIRLIN